MKRKLSCCSYGPRKRVAKEDIRSMDLDENTILELISKMEDNMVLDLISKVEDISLEFEENMIIEILLRLPIKSLAIFRCVLKKWNRFITYDPYFCKNYNRLSGDPLMLYVFHNSKFETHPRFTPCSIEAKMMLGSFDHNANLPLHLMNHNLTTTCPWSGALDESLSFVNCDDRKLYVIASSNGFLLCTNKWNYNSRHANYFICNPITKEWFSLPTYTPTFLVTAAFICNKSCNEYKVARISFSAVYFNHLTIEVFNQTDLDWKNYNLTFSCPLYINRAVNGVISEKSGLIYFQAMKTVDNSWSPIVIVFDEHSSQLEIIQLPLSVDKLERNFQLAQVNGRIVCAQSSDAHAINLWMFDEDTRTWSSSLQYNGAKLTQQSMDQSLSPIRSPRSTSKVREAKNGLAQS